MNYSKAVETKVDINIQYLQMDLPIQLQDEIPKDYPFIFGKVWRPVVDIESGQICNFPPQAHSQEISLNVADSGRYTLHDRNFRCVHRYEGFVPNQVVPSTYGNCVELNINERGKITNWPDKVCLDQLFESYNVYDHRIKDLFG